MAEIRKHKPRSTSSIGDQVRASVGTGPRPVAPGEQQAPDFDPFFVDDQAPSDAASAVSFAATTIDPNGWFSFVPADPPGAAVPAASESADEEGSEGPTR